MARYQRAIRTRTTELIEGVQPGQWIDYEGTRGRFMGRTAGCIRIAWGKTATHRFPQFARTFHDAR